MVIEIWGFPYLLAEIGFEQTGERRRCRVRADGQDVLTLEIEPLPTSPKNGEGVLYSVKDGQPLRTTFLLQGISGASEGPEGVVCTLGDHPIALELRAWGMQFTPVFRGMNTRLEYIFPRAQERLPLQRGEPAQA